MLTPNHCTLNAMIWITKIWPLHLTHYTVCYILMTLVLFCCTSYSLDNYTLYTLFYMTYSWPLHSLCYVECYILQNRALYVLCCTINTPDHFTIYTVARCILLTTGLYYTVSHMCPSLLKKGIFIAKVTLKKIFFVLRFMCAFETLA